MSPISSNTVFHFTGTLENLVGILTNEFRPSYCVEDLSPLRNPGNAKFVLAFPLVAFCDIPMSQATDQMATYGRYALGLSRDWAMRQGLTPVLYTHADGATMPAINALVQHAGDQGVKEINVLDQAYKLLFYSKPYRGRLWRSGTWRADTCFYNEREWRFVPDGKPFKDIRVLVGDDALSEDMRASATEQVTKRLSFAPSDIRYVIVGAESEILPMIEELERIKGPKYTWSSVKLLTSRLLSAEQIRSDL
jgi:hypothetical protein